MSALNTAGSTVAVEVDGTLVPLPNDQVLDGFTADGASETFTVPATGNYLIAYAVRTMADLQMSSRIMRNGAELAGSVVTPAAAADSFTNMQIAQLSAGDTLALQLFNLSGSAVLQAGTGASLNVIRLS